MRERTFCAGVKDGRVYLNNPDGTTSINDGGCIYQGNCDLLLVAFKSAGVYYWHLSAINNREYQTKTTFSVTDDREKEAPMSAVMRRYKSVSNNEMEIWNVDGYTTFNGAIVDGCTDCFKFVNFAQKEEFTRVTFSSQEHISYQGFATHFGKPLFVTLTQTVGKLGTPQIYKLKYRCYLFYPKDVSNFCSLDQKEFYSAKLTTTTVKPTPTPTTKKVTTKPVITTTLIPNIETKATIATTKDTKITEKPEGTTIIQTTEEVVTISPISIEDLTTSPETKNKNKSTIIIICAVAGLIILIMVIGCFVYRYWFVNKNKKMKKSNNYSRTVGKPSSSPWKRTPARPVYRPPVQPKRAPPPPSQATLQPQSMVSGTGTEFIPHKPSKKGAHNLLTKGKSEVSGMSDLNK